MTGQTKYQFVFHHSLIKTVFFCSLNFLAALTEYLHWITFKWSIIHYGESDPQLTIIYMHVMHTVKKCFLQLCTDRVKPGLKALFQVSL